MSNDLFTGTNANDTFNGGTDLDTVTFAGNAAGYRIDYLDDGRIQIVDIDLGDGDTGTDTVTGIEKLKFADKTYSLANSPSLYPDGEVQIHSTMLGDQTNPAVTGLKDGGYVVTWVSPHAGNLDIYAQRFDSDGNAIGAETLVNTFTSAGQNLPDVVGLANGGYIITWTSDTQDGSNWGIYAQRFDALGNKVGAETQVNSYTTSHQYYPAAAAFTDGSYIITWSSAGQDSSGWGIYAQRYDAFGNTVGAANRINSFTSGDQLESAVTVLSNGGYVISWTSGGQDGSGDGIYGQRFDAAGNPLGPEMRFNFTAANSQYASSITALANGFVVTWVSNSQDGSGAGVYLQRFDNNGVALGAETRANTFTPDNQSVPDITALADGGFVVTWQSPGQEAAGWSIYAQRYDAVGAAVGSEFLVNSTVVSDQALSSVTALTDGGFLVTWQSFNQDGSGNGIYAQRYDAEGNSYAPGALAINGTITHDVINAGSGDQVINGLAGNDTLSGGAGVDVLIGGTGNDIYIVDDGDSIVEGSGTGTDTVQADFSYTLANFLENLTLTGSDNINGTGNSANNIIIGNISNNKLYGNGGNDTLTGGAGGDTLTGGNGADAFVIVSTTGKADTIKDFTAADVIQLENGLFTQLAVTGALSAVNFVANATGVAMDANDHVVYNTTTGEVFYDSNGSSGGGITKIAILTGIPTLTAADFEVI